MADGKVTITIDLDGTSAQQGVKSLKSLLQGLGDTSSNGFNTGSKSAIGFGAAMAVASAAVQKGMTVISSSVGGAIDRFDTMQKFPKMMSALGYSTDAAKKSINKLRDGIQGLPTALDEVVATAQGLTLLNGDLGKSTDLTLALNNAFLSSGATAGDASRGLTQFSQMMAKGKVDLQSWNTLVETMPLALDAVAKSFLGADANQRNLYDALQDGTIQFDQLGDKMIELNDGVGGFAELAQINSIGIATSIQNVKTAVKNGLESMIASFDTAAKNKGLGGIAKNLDKLKTAVSRVFVSSTPYVIKFVDVLSWVVDATKRMLAAFKNTGAVNALTKAFSSIQGALEHVFSSLGQNKGFVDGLGKSFGEIVKWIAKAVTKAADFISSLPPGTIQGIASAVLGAVAAFKGIKTAVSAVNSLKTAFGLLKAAISGNPFMVAVVAIGALVGWFIHAYTTSETFRAKVDEVVAVISKVAGKIKEFLSGVDPSFIAMLVPVLGLLLTKIKGFDLIGKFNPFSIFKKNAKDAFDGASGSASQSKGIIEQVFSGLGTLITSIAQGISTVLQGLATALSTLAQGFGTAAAMASPAQWLSMGAAMLMVGAGVALASAGIYVLVQAAIQLSSAGSGAAIALAGLGVGIAALAGVFALLGPALTAGAVGIIAFGAAVALIGAGIGMAAAGLAMLASQLPTIATYGVSSASAILALSGAVVAFGAGVTVAGAGLLVLSAGLVAFGAASLVAAAGGVALAAGIVVVSAAVATFGLALQPVASAVEKMGKGAKDAGTGTKQLASGLKSITSLPLGSLVTHLGAVAIGIGNISSKGSEIASVGSGMSQLGQGLIIIATSGTMAVTSITTIGTAIVQLSTQMTTLPTAIEIFKSQIMTIAPALMMACTSLASFNSQAMVVSGVLSGISNNAMILGTALAVASIGFGQVSLSISGISLEVAKMASGTQVVIVAFNSMSSQVQSSMQTMLNVVRSVGNQMQLQGSQTGQQTGQNIAQGIRGGTGQTTSAMQALMNAIRSVGMSGISSMRNVGAMIGQGLAQGMYSSLGAVTEAANALIEQAERAAQAKAKIHSPSRLFRDTVGRFIPQGIAVGIAKDAYKVDDAMGDIYSQIQSFSYKAEDIIGVGKSKLSKVVQVQQRFEQAVKASVEVKEEKQKTVFDELLKIGGKLLDRRTDIVLDTGVLVGATVDAYTKSQTHNAKMHNRMRGIL